ncbi:carbohydrate-binding protein [Leucobacter luti]
MTGSYAKGDRVTHRGATYEAVQTHRGSGDPSWINARSLWKRVG